MFSLDLSMVGHAVEMVENATIVSTFNQVRKGYIYDETHDESLHCKIKHMHAKMHHIKYKFQ